MRFNFEIDILGAKWTVRESPLILTEESAHGMCDSEKKEILISSEGTEFQKKGWFLHEYGHAIEFELGLEDESPPSWVIHMLINGYAKDMLRNKKFFVKFFR